MKLKTKSPSHDTIALEDRITGPQGQGTILYRFLGRRQSGYPINLEFKNINYGGGWEECRSISTQKRIQNTLAAPCILGSEPHHLSRLMADTFHCKSCGTIILNK